MHHLVSGTIGGVIALAGIGVLAPFGHDSRAFFGSVDQPPQVEGPLLHDFNRAAKGDRLSRNAPSPQGGPEIVTTEVLGGVSVIYRDRDGRAVSYIDQTANVTYIAKTGALSGPTPYSQPRAPERKPAVQGRDLPVGCEAAVSVTADPVLARTASRCIS